MLIGVMFHLNPNCILALSLSESWKNVGDGISCSKLHVTHFFVLFSLSSCEYRLPNKKSNIMTGKIFFKLIRFLQLKLMIFNVLFKSGRIYPYVYFYMRTKLCGMLFRSVILWRLPAMFFGRPARLLLLVPMARSHVFGGTLAMLTYLS